MFEVIFSDNTWAWVTDCNSTEEAKAQALEVFGMEPIEVKPWL